jgi:hypothetical protein
MRAASACGSSANRHAGVLKGNGAVREVEFAYTQMRRQDGLGCPARPSR